MKRRRLLTSLGTLVGGTSLALSTGAFTSVSAERSVSVDVTDDAYAFLRLNERGRGERSEIDGGTLKFNIPGDDEDGYPSGNPTDPEGLGTDSVYRFGQDAEGGETGLFGITNHGTQPVKVYSTQSSTSNEPSVTIFDVETGNLLTENDPSDPLGVGDQLLCGLEIDTYGVPVQAEEYDVSLMINAVATDD
ncbi:hypothetical protein [Halobaculum rubrum]|uniref:hypothetical protein n=1 Tax=Halobaculum rubrum TaxID=2872158 RepID=UPI001CECFD18|nr:hypothetical protein [Halobaculum rubrum]